MQRLRMAKRKIDDNQLLQMINEGKMQKEVAELFRVSPAAVCKRLKRLLPKPEPILERHKLTDQQKQFVIEKAKGKTNTQAVMASYEVSSLDSAKVIGSQLMAKPEIKLALNELMDCHLPQHHRIRKLRSHVVHPDPNISLKALEMANKLDGSYAPEKHLAIISVREESLRLDEELRETRARIAQLKSELEIPEAEDGN
jgi:predicted transcriptional regulator